MRRRWVSGLVATLGGGTLLLPPARAQRVASLGVLATFPPSVDVVAPQWSAFYAELGARGWSEGRNLVIQARYNQGRPERDAALAAELAALSTEVVLATSSTAVDAARTAMPSTPIVMVNVSHAVEAGFVASLARPGGLVTGVINQAGDMQGKFIEILRSIRPGLSRLGVLWSPANLGSSLAYKDLTTIAARDGLRVLSLPIEQAADIERALRLARAEGVEAIHVHPTPAIGGQWRQVMAWALEAKVATLGQAAWVREGFLLSYWARVPDLYRTAAGLVDRILRGAKPAELPVEQPTRFELTINQRTARAIGLQVPKSLLLRADEVLE